MFVLGLAFIAGCARVERVSPVQTPLQQQEIQERIEPTVRDVAQADEELLWKAALDFMTRLVRGRDGLAIVDPRRRVIETRLLEWREDGLPHRTRITVEIVRTPNMPGGLRLGVVALLIEAVVDYPGAISGRPLPQAWTLLGNNPDIEGVVADQIMRRYLLLRQGQDPDQVPIEELRPGLRRVTEQR